MRWFRLWGLTDSPRDIALSAVTLVALLVSRFTLLASGPWEWDETIFARGMLSFDLAAHFPHPPGFPGLLALGHLALPFAGTAYEALQWVSAACGVLIVWPLARIGRTVAPAPVAAAASLLVVSLVGPWLYSVRGFSTTTALFFLTAAAALWAGGLQGRRADLFTILVATSFLVRPVLLPTLGLLWLAAAHGVRPRRRLVPGVAAAAILVLTAIAVMIHLQGGWAAFARPFTTHAVSHASRLDLNTKDLLDLGLIKGVGGPAPAAALAATCLAGLFAWSRRTGRKTALVWALLMAVTISQLLWLQNRSYSRYAAAVHLASAPLLAGAAGLLPTPLATVSLLGLTAWAASTSLPLVAEQHAHQFGAWAVTQKAAEVASREGWAAVVEPEVHVFSSYLWHELERQGRHPPPMVLSPRAPEPWLGVDRPWVVATVHPQLYLPSLGDLGERFGGVSDRLRPLTQDRFLDAELLDNPPLPVGQWWTREHLEDGTAFMWAGAGAELWIPPLPAGSAIAVRARPMPGDEPLSLSTATCETVHRLAGHADAQWFWFPAAQVGPTIVRFDRACGYPPGNGDDRHLAVQVLGIRIRPAGRTVEVADLEATTFENLGVSVTGHHAIEDFSRTGRGFWLEPEARVEMSISEPGELQLVVSAPRPTDPRLRLVLGERQTPTELRRGAVAQSVAVRVLPGDIVDGRIRVRLASDAYVPAASGRGRDSRRLGVVLHRLQFRPDSAPQSGWW